MLWMLALMLGSMGSFNSGGGSSNTNSSNEYQNQYQYQDQESKPANLVGMVLGETNIRPDYSYVSQAIASIGTGNIVLFSIALVVFIVFSIFVSLFTQSWAYGAFLGGIDDAIGDRNYSLRDLGSYGRKSLREIIRYRSLFVISGVIIIVVAVVSGLSALLADMFTLLAVAMLLLIPIFILLFVLSLGNNFTLRFIVLKGSSAFDAIKAGLKMFMNNIGKVFILAITNCLVVSALMLVTLGIFVGVLLSFILPGSFINFENMSQGLVVAVVLLLVPLLFALIGVFMAVGAYLTTYKNFTWSMFFNFMVQGDQPNGTK